MKSRLLAVRLMLSLSAAALSLLCVLSATAKAQQRDTAPYLRPAHREIVRKWLAGSPRRANLRVAIDRDCRNKDGLAAARRGNRNYQPYYVIGDFNSDRREDFAVAFVNDKRRQAKFSFVIFNGPFESSSDSAYVDENVDLSIMGFSYRGRGSFLLLGEFESDYCVIFRPRGKTYLARPCLGD